MPAKPAHVPSKPVHPAEGRVVAAGDRGRARRARAEQDSVAEMFNPPPLPRDPVILEEIRQRIEVGLAEARAGIGEDWDVVYARLFGPSTPR